MSAEQLEDSLMKLPREERLRFAQWFYEHENDILEPREDTIHPAIQAEILRRRQEVDAHPERLEAWEARRNERAGACMSFVVKKPRVVEEDQFLAAAWYDEQQQDYRI